MAAASACSVARACNSAVAVGRARENVVKNEAGLKRSQAVFEDGHLAREKAKRRRVISEYKRQEAELIAKEKKILAEVKDMLALEKNMFAEEKKFLAQAKNSRAEEKKLLAKKKNTLAMVERVKLAVALVKRQTEEDRLDNSTSGVLERLGSRAQELRLK